MSTLPPPDAFLASAVQYLVEGSENDAAAILLGCTIELEPRGTWDYFGGKGREAVDVEIAGPRMVVDALADWDNSIGKSIQRAISALMPSDKYANSVVAWAQYIEIDGNWRQELQKMIKGNDGLNQGMPIEGSEIQVWHGLRFRSKTEVKIAQTLQGRNVLFFPNCRARLRIEDGFGSREPDFLVCQEGKWGILQVDGEPWHSGYTRAKEQRDDLSFQKYGIKVVLHFSANRCWENTDGVVDEFLDLLDRIG